MHSLLVIEPAGTENPAEARSSGGPDHILSSCGYVVGTAVSPEQAAPFIGDADAFILNLPVTDISHWRSLLVRHKVAPVIWWCTPHTANLSVSACGDDIMVDGILSPAMKPPQIHWTLHFSARQCFERKQWLKEREQLLSRIEERK